MMKRNFAEIAAENQLVAAGLNPSTVDLQMALVEFDPFPVANSQNYSRSSFAPVPVEIAFAPAAAVLADSSVAASAFFAAAVLEAGRSSS